MARFTDQVAVIAGGASGIGEGIARRIVSEGGKVVLLDIDRTRLEQVATEIGAVPLLIDMTVEKSVAEGFDEVLRRFGRLDIAVNSAGIVGPTGTKIVDYASETFLRVLNINLFGAFYFTKYALPPMIKANYGRVLHLASVSGKEGNPEMIGYSTSKAGVIGLVKAVGKEYAETGITVNGLAPALISTPLNAQIAPEQRRYMTERIPMKRLGTVAEVASLACWIVSQEASFNTGTVFDLSGGRATY